MSFCGNDCTSCRQKEILQCPGCECGPGNKCGGDCKIVKCCAEKGHDNCETCNTRTSCGLYINREDQPADRVKELESKAQEETARLEKKSELKKLFLVLAIMVLPYTIAFLLNLFFRKNVVIGFIVSGIQVLILLVFGVVLNKMSKYTFDKQLKTASKAYFVMAVGSVCLISGILDSGSTICSIVSIIVRFIMLVAMIMAILKECEGISSVVCDLNSKLSSDWMDLKKGFIFVYIGFPIFMFLGFSIVGIILGVIVAIAYVVLSILRLVLIVRTYKLL